jgi:hypothetical protein
MVEKLIRKETEVEVLAYHDGISFEEIESFLDGTKYHCEYSLDNKYVFPAVTAVISPDIEIFGPSRLKFFPGDILIKDNGIIYSFTISDVDKIFKNTDSKEKLLSW